MSITDFKSSVKGSTILSTISNELENAGNLQLKGVVGSLSSFLIGGLSNESDTVLLITDTNEQARIFKADLTLIADYDVIYFTATNHKPYDSDQIQDSSLLVQRSEAIQAIQSTKKKIVVTSAEALFDKVAPPSQINEVSILVKRESEVDPEKLREELVDQAYQPVRFVDQPGEFAVRGGIIDVFPFSGEYPIRLEFFGDEVDSIREFDASSQRSISFLNEVKIVPDLSNLPDVQKDSLLSYFDEDALIFIKDAPLVEAVLASKFEKAEEAFGESEEEAQEPTSLFLSDKDFIDQISSIKKTIYLGSKSTNSLKEINIQAKPQPDFPGNFDLLKQDIQGNS